MIVCEYADKEAAHVGHDAWVVALTSEKPPDAIRDINLREKFLFGAGHYDLTEGD